MLTMTDYAWNPGLNMLQSTRACPVIQPRIQGGKDHWLDWLNLSALVISYTWNWQKVTGNSIVLMSKDQIYACRL